LPLLICALLGILGAVFSWMAYREVERALLLHGHERMLAAAKQVSEILSQSVAPRTVETARLASDAAVRQLFQESEGGTLDAPPASIVAFTTRALQPATVWLRDANGRVIGYLPTKAETWQTPPSSAPAAAPREGIGELTTSGAHVFYRTTAKVTGANGAETLGFVSLERSLSSSPVTVMIERLIGSGATIRVGNATRDVWTDLSAPSAAPPAGSLEAPTRYVNAQGDARLGTTVAVAGTPWVLWAEMSETSLLAPARTLLRRVPPISVAIMIIGTLAIYFVSARITTPLNEAAAAADGIAAGDYSRRVVTNRKDEIGRLGNAFNIMAGRVGEAHHALEARVSARTTELEQALRALQDAQAELVKRERLAMLGQLASSVGHELRNPLGVMTNAVYYLRMIQEDAPPTVTEYLGILQHQIGLAEKIVGDLLDFARLRPPQIQPVSLRQLVDEQIGRLGPLDKVRIRREGLDDLPPVTIDPMQMGQVLLNLFTNADQAMENGGTLTIRGSVVDGQVVLDVADTGSGIPAGIIDKIFEPLFTTKARGIGLGLAVSKSLAKANGADLKVTSQVGQGATFSLVFHRKGTA
jgi:signal transduction histidine kinase